MAYLPGGRGRGGPDDIQQLGRHWENTNGVSLPSVRPHVPTGSGGRLLLECWRDMKIRSLFLLRIVCRLHSGSLVRFSKSPTPAQKVEYSSLFQENSLKVFSTDIYSTFPLPSSAGPLQTTMCIWRSPAHSFVELNQLPKFEENRQMAEPDPNKSGSRERKLSIRSSHSSSARELAAY